MKGLLSDLATAQREVAPFPESLSVQIHLINIEPRINS
jgi:hypothetical protein